MKLNTRKKSSLSGACLLLASAFFTTVASAGTFDTVTLTGSASDFSGVADVYSNSSATGDMPITSIQITNDASNLYVGITYASAINPDALADGGQETIALDNDANLSTGFDTFSAGVVGSEVAFAYDYPFQQTSASYNTGVEGIAEYGGNFDSTVNYDPYNEATTFEEFSISLADTYTTGGATYAVFPDRVPTFGPKGV
jgi:hypothetical protein